MSPELRQALEKAGKQRGGGGFSIGDIFGAGRKAFDTAIDVVDTPRAAVMSTLGELMQETDASSDTGFSWGDVVKGARDNVSASEALQIDPMQGLAADIVGDPLNYVAPQMVADDYLKAARQLTTRGVEALGEGRAAEAAARLTKARTLSALDDEELAAIGMTGGIFLRTPGTGMVGRTLGVDHVLNKMGIGREHLLASRSSLVGRAGRRASQAAHAPVAKLLNSRAAQWAVRKGGSGDYPQFRNWLRSGDPERAKQGLWGLQATAEGRGVGKGLKTEMAQRAADILSEATRRGVSTKDLYYATGGSVDAASRVGEDLVAEVKTLYGDMLDQANTRAGVDFLADRGDDYVTRFRKTESGPDTGRIPDASIIKQRKYGWDTARGDIDEFEGVKLTNPKENGGVAVEQQMKEAAVAKGWAPEQVDGLFEDDLAKVLPAYIDLLGDQVAREYAGGRLRQVGIADNIFQEVEVSGTAKARAVRDAAEAELAAAEQRAAEAAATGRQTARARSKVEADLTAARAQYDAEVSFLNEQTDAVAEWGAHYADIANRMDAQLQQFLSGQADDLAGAERAAGVARVAAEGDRRALEALEGRLDEAKAARDELAKRAARLEGDGVGELTAQVGEMDRFILQMETAAVGAMGDLGDVDLNISQINQKLREHKQFLDDADSVLQGFPQGGMRRQFEGAELDPELLREQIIDERLSQNQVFQARAEAEARRRYHQGAIAQGEAFLNSQRARRARVVQAQDEAISQSEHGSSVRAQLADELDELVESGVEETHVALADAEREVADFTTNAETQQAKAQHSAARLVDDEERVAQLTPSIEDERYQALLRNQTNNDMSSDMYGRHIRSGWLKGPARRSLRPIVGEDGAAEVIQAVRRGEDFGASLAAVKAAQAAPTRSPYPGVLPGSPDDEYARDLFQGQWRERGKTLRSRTDQTGTDVPLEDPRTGRTLRDPVFIEGAADDPTFAAGMRTNERFAERGGQQFGRVDPVYGADPAPADVGYETSPLDPEKGYGTAQGPVPASTHSPMAPPPEDELVTELLAEFEMGLADATRRRARERYGRYLKGQSSERTALEANQRRASAAWRQRAQRLYDEAARQRTLPVTAFQDNGAMAQVAALEAQAADAEAAWLAAASDVDAASMRLDSPVADAEGEKLFGRLRDADVQSKLVPMMRDGFRKFGSTTQAPEDMVEVMVAAQRLSTPDGLFGVLNTYDKAQSLWKAYALATPGFHSRNMLGGVINNYLADMDPVAYQRYLGAATAQASGKFDDFAKRHPDWAEAFQAAESMGARTGGMSVAEVEANLGQKANWRPWSVNFAPLQGNRHGAHLGGRMIAPGSEQVENLLRGSLFMDTFVKTGDQSEAFAKMMRYHFDYDELSALEMGVVRRIIPFYTWTRKNLPLQIQALAKQPQKVNRYFTIKRNVEAMSEEEGVVPGYYADQYAVRMPFGLGGGTAYAMPDLPTLTLAEVTDPGMSMGMVTPFVKTPIEWWSNKQFFKGIPLSTDLKPAPVVMQAIPGLMPALGTLGFAEKGEQGWMMRDKDIYGIEQFLPTMGKARRVLPNDERFEDRRWASMLSTFLGLGVRSNTEDQQTTELWSRYHNIKDRIDRMEQLGRVDPEEGVSVQGYLGAAA